MDTTASPREELRVVLPSLAEELMQTGDEKTESFVRCVARQELDIGSNHSEHILYRDIAAAIAIVADNRANMVRRTFVDPSTGVEFCEYRIAIHSGD